MLASGAAAAVAAPEPEFDISWAHVPRTSTVEVTVTLVDGPPGTYLIRAAGEFAYGAPFTPDSTVGPEEGGVLAIVDDSFTLSTSEPVTRVLDFGQPVLRVVAVEPLP